MIETIKELVRIPSVSGTPEVKDALRKALEICEGLGFRTKNCDDLLGYGEIGQGDALIGILCHLDVVPSGNGWKHDPFEAAVEDGRLYGRGVIDDKGPAVAAIYAMKDILASSEPMNKRVRIIFGCMEETGEWADMEKYKATEEMPSYGFTPDADFPAIYGEKGILMAELSMEAERAGFLRVEGGEAPNMVADWAKAVLTDGTILSEKGKAAHGSMPEEGENAITKLMEKAAEKNCPFAEFYMKKIGWSLDGSKCGCKFWDKASGGLTFNVGKILLEDGLVKLRVDIRYPVTYTQAQVLESLKAQVSDYGITVQVLAAMNPVYMDKEGPVITRLMEAYRQVTGDDTPAQLMGGGTYARAMENIVAFGPVFPGRECTEHQKDEYIYVEDLEKAREIYRIAIEKLLAM